MCLPIAMQRTAEQVWAKRGVLVLPIAGGVRELNSGRYRPGFLRLRACGREVPHNTGCPPDSITITPPKRKKKNV